MTPSKIGELNLYQENVKRVRKMIHFRELRHGKDLSYLFRRAIKFGEFSGNKAHSSRHLLNMSVATNSFITVYDYDLKAFSIALILLIILFVKRIFSKN